MHGCPDTDMDPLYRWTWTELKVQSGSHISFCKHLSKQNSPRAHCHKFTITDDACVDVWACCVVNPVKSRLYSQACESGEFLPVTIRGLETKSAACKTKDFGDDGYYESVSHSLMQDTFSKQIWRTCDEYGRCLVPSGLAKSTDYPRR